MKKPLAVGVDLGGTWLRVLALQDNGRVFRSLRAPAVPLAELPMTVRSIWRRWRVSPRDVESLVLASRGIWTRRERGRLARRLSGLARSVQVISDVEAAYRGALGTQPGILLLAGTGSIALGRTANGQWVRRGGMGPLLGDEGSAFWIGREYLRAVTQGEDFAPAREILNSPNAVARIAALAPRVVKRAAKGTWNARAIVSAAQRHLADLVVELASTLRVKGPIRLSWAGSLMENSKFRAGVYRAARRSGLKVVPVLPSESPSHAAAHLALELAHKSTSRD